jgi:type IV/VI secretion system ImpK/VasF family protein
MASTTALWFAIEAAFTDVDKLCVEERAAELSLESRKRDDTAAKALGQGRRAAVQDAEPRRPPEPRELRATERAKDLAFQKKHPDGANFVVLRENVRQRLTDLEREVRGALPEHEMHYVLFPIVVHFDELVRQVSPVATLRWEPLQSELYKVDNGGELFYERLTEQLGQDETARIVFEVFYLCLSDGFQGKHQGEPLKIAEWKAKLALRILPRKPVEPMDEGASATPMELVPFPWHYYAGALAAIVGLYVIFTWLGRIS